MLRSQALKSTSRHPERNTLEKKSLRSFTSKQVQVQENNLAMVNHSITTRGVKRGSSMVDEDDEAECAPLKPFSSAAAIEKSGKKHATKAKALIDFI